MIGTLDTDVLVSGTLFRGVPGRIVTAAIDRRFTLALSQEILTEFRTVLLRPKFGLSADAVEVFVRDVEAHAVEAAADIIVSGDAHLIDLETVEGIRVVTPADFLAMFE